MHKDKKLLFKPNQTIMITNGEITVVQRKAYNVILYKAYNDLKINPNQLIFDFSLAEIKKMAGIKATDNWHLKEDISALKHIDIENVKENGDWSIFSLIAYAQKAGDFLKIQLPEPIRQALIENNYYTTLDLLVIKSLESKYAVIFYEMAIRYCKKQIPEMTIEEVRSLTGTENKKSYNNFNNFETYVLKPAIKEINSNKTDIILTYEIKTLGKKTVGIKFFVELKEEDTLEPEPEPEQIDIEYYKINMLARLFYEETGVEFPVNDLKELVEQKGYNVVRDYFLNAKRFNYKSPVGFFIKAIKESYKIPEQMRNPKKSKAPQQGNFEQRKYEKGYLDSLYDNFN